MTKEKEKKTAPWLSPSQYLGNTEQIPIFQTAALRRFQLLCWIKVKLSLYTLSVQQDIKGPFCPLNGTNNRLWVVRIWKCTKAWFLPSQTLNRPVLGISLRAWKQGQRISDDSKNSLFKLCSHYLSFHLFLSSTGVYWFCSNVITGQQRTATSRCPPRPQWSSWSAESTATRWPAPPTSPLMPSTSVAAPRPPSTQTPRSSQPEPEYSLTMRH